LLYENTYKFLRSSQNDEAAILFAKGWKYMNKVILMGRLTRDPLITEPANENTQLTARYTLAVNKVRKNNGQEEADYINCVAFGARASFAKNYLKQGIKITIVGRLQSGSYINKEGIKVYVTEVIIEEQEFVETRYNKPMDYNRQEGEE
jgi:single-strand DNA-binding protein